MKNMTIGIDLDVDTPEKVPALLREIAEKFDEAAGAYEESQSELQSAWGDENAGEVWPHLAAAMRGAAGRLRQSAKTAERKISLYV